MILGVLLVVLFLVDPSLEPISGCKLINYFPVIVTMTVFLLLLMVASSLIVLLRVSVWIVASMGVEIQTAALLVTLWISYGHLARIKRACCSFEFHLSIVLAVI